MNYVPGNIVSFKDQFVFISEKNIEKANNPLTSGYVGIPITPAILLMSGFTPRKVKEKRIFEMPFPSQPNVLELHEKESSWSVFIRNRDIPYRFVSLPEIQYLHEFQNCVKSISGKDYLVPDALIHHFNLPPLKQNIFVGGVLLSKGYNQTTDLREIIPHELYLVESDEQGNNYKILLCSSQDELRWKSRMEKTQYESNPLTQVS